ncbi:hypothetical protein PENTCL1PPCAC_11830 [Pristionchus entomophagus]|uniref:C2H2-type domain-containing protein n=1 Tax=Pristionchus entomophagus TaxID=358040 RepID=A0AAV5TBA4_9BILA|nr:hypothetical protein PENTCL1PPCAC_11830 [Pristionchus entomophagus]
MSLRTCSVLITPSSDHDDIMRIMKALELERAIAVVQSVNENDVFRHLVYGLIESVQLTLIHKQKELIDTQISNVPPFPSFNFENGFLGDYLDGKISVATQSEENSINDDQEDVKENGKPEDSTGTKEVKKEERPSEKTTKCEKDGDMVIAPKRRSLTAPKRLSVSQPESEKKPRVMNRRRWKMMCPECRHPVSKASELVSHLRSKHSTTPLLAGFTIRCDCGNESHSDHHFRECDNTKFTVIRKTDEPIRRIHDPKETPQCVMCETYPSTPGGYIDHLHRYHKTTLIQNGIYLRCKCGIDVHSTATLESTHNKKCDGRLYTLHYRIEE